MEYRELAVDRKEMNELLGDFSSLISQLKIRVRELCE
jgi:hypothetical protein